MSIKDFMSDNLPTFLSIGACAGVIGTGYLAMETGREIERKSEKKSIIKKLFLQCFAESEQSY